MTLIGENKRLTFREEKGFERRFRKKAPISATLRAALPPGQCPAQGPPPTTGWGVRTRGPRAAGRGRVGVSAPTPGTAGGSGRSGEKAAPRGPRGGPGPLRRGSLDKETQGGWPRDVEAYRGDASTTQGTPRTDPPPEARRVGSPGEPGPADTWLRARAAAAPLSSARRAGLCRGARGAAPHPQAPGPASPPPASPWLARVSFWKSCILSALRLLSWTEKGADASSSRVTRGGRRRRVPSTGRGGGRNRAARPAPALTLPGSVQALQSKRKRASLLEDRVL